MVVPVPLISESIYDTKIVNIRLEYIFIYFPRYINFMHILFVNHDNHIAKVIEEISSIEWA